MGETYSLRKIVIGYILFFTVLFAFFFGNKLYILRDTNSHKYQSESGISYVAKIQDKEFLVYNNRDEWSRMFIAGVNLGAAKPGYYPGAFGITREEYLRWFGYISDMNANTIRVYTAQMPVFYQTLLEYNSTAENPLYLIQGVYLNEADIAELQDAFAMDGKIKNDFYADIQNIVDIIHGNAVIEKLPGHAGGTYTADISNYVCAYILGIEWDPDFVIATNENNLDKTSYDGDFVKTQNASAFEVFLAGAADAAITHETETYREQRPVSLCNWVTTDPLEHPNEPNENEDSVIVDMEHIVAKSGFEAGFFASYHIYPYYPDFFSYEAKYLQDGENNTYAAYLKELNAYHSMPVLVAEVGIPASRGITHENSLSGFNQGHIEETRQGEMLISLFGDIRDEGCMGALIFSWNDEWFKTTWNTMDLDIADSRAYWPDYQTNEQNFGLLAFDPGDKASVSYVDGDVTEWSDSDLVVQQGENRLYAKSDEKFLYLMVNVEDFENDTLYIPIDTILGQGNTAYQGVRFDSAADFLLVLSGKENSSVLVDPYYDVTYYQYAIKSDHLLRFPQYESTDSGMFVPITQVLSRALYIPLTGETVPFRLADTGKLSYGNANPDASDYDSLADFYYSDGCVEIRIPWLMLNVMDPSQKKIIGNLYQNDGFVAQDVEAFRLGVVPSDGQATAMGEYRWDVWEMPTYHERLKKSYYIVQDTFASYTAAHMAQRTPFEVFWAEWNLTSFSKIVTWFPIQPVLNYMIAFLMSIILYFFCVLLYIHITSMIRDRAKDKIKAKIMSAIKLRRDHGIATPLFNLISLNKLLSRHGLIILNEMFEQCNQASRQTLRSLIYNCGYESFIRRKLQARNLNDLILVVRLVGELGLKKLAGEVIRLLYKYKDDIDLQYQSFLTLSQLACRDQLVRICMDRGFIHRLSFRSLQEALKTYSGNKPDLYRALLKSPDRYIVRICMKRIGAEHFISFAQDLMLYLDSDDYNTVIDAARALGQLGYDNAAPKLIALMSHKKWEVRNIAASALGAIDANRYANELVNALHDSEWHVRFNAAKALSTTDRSGEFLQTVRLSGDRYAFEILSYMIQNPQLRGATS